MLDTVKVDKNTLLAAVRTNRETHIAEYAEALQGWREKIDARLDEISAKVNEGDYEDLQVTSGLPKPQSHEEDYDEAIAMLEMSTEDVIDLDHHQFNALVLDKWEWKRGFTATNASYANAR